MTRDGHDADGAAWNAGMHCWRDGSVVMLSSSVVQVSFIVALDEVFLEIDCLV